MQPIEIEQLTDMIHCNGIDVVVEEIAHIFKPDESEKEKEYYNKCSDILYLCVEALKHANDNKFELVLIKHSRGNRNDY